jgi:hypothetical protein
MTDVLFKCPHCLKHFVIEGAGVGWPIHCTECTSTFKIPKPAIVFFCPRCDRALCASEGCRGEGMTCPGCNQPITVPVNTTLRCPACSAHLEFEDKVFHTLAGRTIDCPECGGAVPIPACESMREVHIKDHLG